MLPARAAAKFSFRLVPNQDPKKITEGLRKFFAGLVTPGITMKLTDFHGAPGIAMSLDSSYIAAAADWRRREGQRWYQHEYRERYQLIHPSVERTDLASCTCHH